MAVRSHLRLGALACLLLTGLGSCAPSYYQLSPVSGDVARLDGRLVTKAERDSVVVVASYEREDMEYVALDIEIKNRSERPLHVDPAQFQVWPLDADSLTPVAQTSSANMPLFRMAADPYFEAEQVKLKQRREEIRLKRAKVFNTVLLVATVAADVASSTSAGRSRNYDSWHTSRIRFNNTYALIAMKRVIDHGSFADNMQRLDFEAYRWSELALRPTTLPPGESVRGFVYLPKTRTAKFVKLIYPVQQGGRSVDLLFQQQLVKLRPQ